MALHSSVTGSFIVTVTGLGPAVIWGGTGEGAGSREMSPEAPECKRDRVCRRHHGMDQAIPIHGAMVFWDIVWDDCMAGIANVSEDRGSAKAIFQ